MTELTAIGVTCGIGSMLVGARKAGFDVLGNVEWRKYYHARDAQGRNTFKENFPRVIFKEKITDLSPEEIERMMNPTLALGHPECGNFSQLNANKAMASDPTDIPIFVDLIAQLRPRFFVMDDLPKSLGAFSMQEYMDRLPDYDLFPEWVSNWGYGNVQRQRNRMFMLGSLREERWAFVAGEARHEGTVASVIGDLPEPRVQSNVPNHDVHALDEGCAKGLHLKHRGHRATWREMQDYVLNEMKEGAPIKYVTESGEMGLRVGSYKGHWHGPAHVLTGGISGFHPLRGLPYTIRERAMLQGFPEDFVFYGTVYNVAGEWNHDRNMHMVRQTGKAMPVQFCTYVSQQIADQVQGRPLPERSRRVLQSNAYVDQAKSWFCETKGYADQERACGACWLYDRCTIRARKYRIGEPAVGQRDAFDPGVVPLPQAAGSAPKAPRRSPPAPIVPVPATVVAPRPPRRFADVLVDQTDLEFS
jgi:DNA (cytosine-5)-methyltransferase 1